jgi:hypothetical protein
MKLYLDNCCFNRPFDDQAQARVREEADAVLAVQNALYAGSHNLVWSYMLDYENQKNPVLERRVVIELWRNCAEINVAGSDSTLLRATAFLALGFGKMDSLHLACAEEAGADCFLTTDDGVLNKAGRVSAPVILNPVDFVKEVLHAH